MFDRVPTQVWLLIAIAAVAYAPALYIFKFVANSPSRRDITQKAPDLSWRTTGQFARSLTILGGLIALAFFIFTKAAAQFARSPSFLSILIACVGARALFSVLMGFMNGTIQPFMRGVHNTFARASQPERFWLSLAWNAFLGCGCIWLALESYQDASADVVRDQCFDQHRASSPQKVISACDDLIADSPDPQNLAAYLVGRGVGYSRLGDYRHAIADYNKASRLNPGEYYAPYNRGVAYQQVGEFDRALTEFNAAIELQPNNPDAYFNRGLIFLDVGALHEAVTDLTRAHELKTKDPWPLANRGLAYAWMKDAGRAENDFRAVRAIDPSNSVMLRGEAILRLNAGDKRGAVDRLTASMVREPDNLWALRRRAELYWDLGEEEKSAEDDRRWQELTRKARTLRASVGDR